MEIIQIVHGVVGDNTEMLIEGHGRFNRSTAMKIGKELEKYPNIGWFEEPVIPEDIEGMAMLSKSLKIPIAAGERLITSYDFTQLFKLNSVSIAQPDLINTGGIIELLKIGAMAEANNISIAPTRQFRHFPHPLLFTGITISPFLKMVPFSITVPMASCPKIR